MATKQPTPKFGLCLDWETSGALWGGDSASIYQGLSFGAIVFNTEDFSVVEEVYVEVKFDAAKYQWTDGAAKIHGLTIEHLEEHGISQEDAAILLAELILKYWGPDGKVMFLGHNPGFDIRFTHQLMEVIDIEFSVERKTKMGGWIPLHHVVLDTSAAGFIAFNLYKSDLLFKHLGFADRADHNALQDARQTLETCAVIRAIGIGMVG